MVLCRKNASVTASASAGATRHLDPKTGTPLLHLRRPELHVEGSRREQRLPQGSRYSGLRSSRSVDSNTTSPASAALVARISRSALGYVFGSLPPAPQAPAEVARQCAGGPPSERTRSRTAPVGVVASPVTGPFGAMLDSLKEDRCSRRGNRDDSMCGPHPTIPHCDRAIVNPSDSELLEALNATHDVHQRVHRTNLVQRDLVGSHPMDLSLRFSQEAERAHGPLTHPLRKRRPLDDCDQFPDVTVWLVLVRRSYGVLMSVMGVLVVEIRHGYRWLLLHSTRQEDVHLGGSNTAAFHRGWSGWLHREGRAARGENEATRERRRPPGEHPAPCRH